MHRTSSLTRSEFLLPLLALIYAILPLPGLMFPELISGNVGRLAFVAWQLPPSLFAFVCSALTIRSRSLPRATGFGRALIATGWGLVFIGDTMFFVSQSGLGSEWWQDASPVPYLVANLTLFFALASLLIVTELRDRIRTAIDSLVLTCCAGLLSWHFLIVPALQNVAPGAKPRLILVVYTFSILCLLSLSLFLLASSRAHTPILRSRSVLCGAFFLIYVSNTILLFGSANNQPHFTYVGQYVWCVALLCAGLSALQVRWQSPSFLEKSLFQFSRVLPAVLPFGFAAVSVALIIPALHENSRANRADILVAITVLLLIIARQLLIAGQNVHLQNMLIRFNQELDDLVALRTRQLEAQNAFTSELNNCIHAEEVIATIQRGIERVLPRAPFALWLDSTMTADSRPALARTNTEDELKAWIESFVPRAERRERESLFRKSALPAELVFVNSAFKPVRTLHVLALEKSGERFGFIGVAGPETLDPTDANLLAFVATQGALALHTSRLYERALVQAKHDDVTGLLNHRGVQERYESAFEHARTENLPLCIVVMDMDRFKLFNDTYGHAVGDLMLQRVAEILKEEADEKAIFGRYGGDEFVLIFPDTTREVALRRTLALGLKLNSSGFVIPGQTQPVPLPVSFGIAEFPHDATSLHRLMSVADSNLYAARNAGLLVKISSENERERARLKIHDSFGALDAIVAAIDAKDAYTCQHSEDVTTYALQLAQALGLSENTRKMLRTGAMLHDVGKIGVADEILCKPGQLSPEEFAQMKQHPWIGAILVTAMPGLGNIIEVVRSHHERYDGTGYPDRLKGDSIPMLARLVAVVDAFSAMTQHRPYRRALSLEEALERIEAGAGTQFDPAMARAWVQLKRSTTPATAIEKFDEEEPLSA